MATQGMLVVTRGSTVKAKIICGSNGFNVDALAVYIRQILVEDRVPTVLEMLNAASLAEFGSDHDLVVMTESEAVWAGGDIILNPRYRDTFADPNFNPRWANGLVPNLRVLEINDIRRRPERRKITRTVQRRKITRHDAYAEIKSCVLMENLTPFGEADAMVLRPGSTEP